MLGSSGDRQQAGRAPNTPLLPFIERKNKERIVQITARPRGSPTRRSVTRRCGLPPQARGEQPGEATPHLGAPCGRSQRHRGPHGRPRPSPQPPPPRTGRAPPALTMAAGCPSRGAALGWAPRSAHLMAAQPRRHPPFAEPPPPPPRPRGPSPAAEHGEPRGAGKGRRRAGRCGPREGPGTALLQAARPQLLQAHPAALPAPPHPPEAAAQPRRPIAVEAVGSRACAVRLSAPPSAILKKGAMSRRAGGRCALGGAPRPAPALLRVRARPFPPCRKREEEGRGSFGHAPSEGWACWRVSGAGVARQRGGGRRGLGPEPGPEPRPMPRPRFGVPLPALVTRMAGPRSTFVSSNHTSYGSQSLLWHFSVTRDR